MKSAHRVSCCASQLTLNILERPLEYVPVRVPIVRDVHQLRQSSRVVNLAYGNARNTDRKAFHY